MSLIGREQERAPLDCWRCQRRRRQVVVLSGESGIGKSAVPCLRERIRTNSVRMAIPSPHHMDSALWARVRAAPTNGGRVLRKMPLSELENLEQLLEKRAVRRGRAAPLLVTYGCRSLMLRRARGTPQERGARLGSSWRKGGALRHGHAHVLRTRIARSDVCELSSGCGQDRVLRYSRHHMRPDGRRLGRISDFISLIARAASSPRAYPYAGRGASAHRHEALPSRTRAASVRPEELTKAVSNR